VEPVIAIALIGEVLAWVGLIGAIVPLGIGMLIRLIDGGWAPVDLILDERTAHWMVDGRGFSRELDDHEFARLEADDEHPAYVARNRPSAMQLEPHSPAARAFLIVGVVLAAVGVVGLAVSMLPLFA
jgi:hypothetical protein